MTSGWARSPASPLGVRCWVTRSSHSALSAATCWRYDCEEPSWAVAARPAAMAVRASRASAITGTDRILEASNPLMLIPTNVTSGSWNATGTR